MAVDNQLGGLSRFPLVNCNELNTSAPGTANIAFFVTTLFENIRVVKTTLTANETPLSDNRLKT